jgi:hypothetical protein
MSNPQRASAFSNQSIGAPPCSDHYLRAARRRVIWRLSIFEVEISTAMVLFALRVGAAERR